MLNAKQWIVFIEYWKVDQTAWLAHHTCNDLLSWVLLYLIFVPLIQMSSAGIYVYQFQRTIVDGSISICDNVFHTSCTFLYVLSTPKNIKNIDIHELDIPRYFQKSSLYLQQQNAWCLALQKFLLTYIWTSLTSQRRKVIMHNGGNTWISRFGTLS